jgi:hypothetical protein
MQMIPLAVYAQWFSKELQESTGRRDRPGERWEPEPPGLRDVVRVAGAIGALAAFAGFLTLAAH